MYYIIDDDEDEDEDEDDDLEDDDLEDDLVTLTVTFQGHMSKVKPQ